MFATVYQDLFLQPAPQHGYSCLSTAVNTFGVIPALCPLQVEVASSYPMILQTQGPSSSKLQLVSTGSPCLLSRCFALPCTSTERSRSDRSAPFCPSPHFNLLCALPKEARTWSSQTATTGWSLHRDKLAQAWSKHLVPFALKSKALENWENT